MNSISTGRFVLDDTIFEHQFIPFRPPFHSKIFLNYNHFKNIKYFQNLTSLILDTFDILNKVQFNHY